jgi:hypothetical protein
MKDHKTHSLSYYCIICSRSVTDILLNPYWYLVWWWEFCLVAWKYAFISVLNQKTDRCCLLKRFRKKELCSFTNLTNGNLPCNIIEPTGMSYWIMSCVISLQFTRSQGVSLTNIFSYIFPSWLDFLNVQPILTSDLIIVSVVGEDYDSVYSQPRWETHQE